MSKTAPQYKHRGGRSHAAPMWRQHVFARIVDGGAAAQYTTATESDARARLCAAITGGGCNFSAIELRREVAGRYPTISPRVKRTHKVFLRRTAWVFYREHARGARRGMTGGHHRREESGVSSSPHHSRGPRSVKGIFDRARAPGSRRPEFKGTPSGTRRFLMAPPVFLTGAGRPMSVTCRVPR